MDAYFYEAFEEEEQNLKKFLPDHIKVGFSWKTIQEEKGSNPPAALISVRTQSEIPAGWSSGLKGILTRSTGYDHLLRFLKNAQHEVPCGYLPLYCNRAVAEQAMLLWMALLRKLLMQRAQFPSFNRDGITGLECEKKTLVVVGVGNIGSEVARIGMGLGMKVMGVDPVKKHDFVDYYELAEVLPQADILVCSMNLTAHNMDYFNYARLKKAKKGVIFINIARGEMSPSADLVRLLKEEHLAAVGMDVYNHEADLAVSLRSGKISSDGEVRAALQLAGMTNAILTPHNAFNTLESVERKSFQSIQQVEEFLKKGSFLWPIPGE
jgi:D-lactate dehydrogenase